MRRHQENIIRTSLDTLKLKQGVEQTAKDYQKSLRRTYKKSKKRIIRYGLLSVNAVLLIAIVGFVTSVKPSDGTVDTTLSALSQQDINPLDQLSSADIAVNVARMAGLEQAVAITNQADSASVQLTSSTQSDARIIAKPQIVNTALKSRHDIEKYVAQAGDTVASLAAKFNVTSDSIRWSNNLIGDVITPGKEIYILPGVNGIIYVVKSGDTADSLAQRYSADKDQLIVMNDAEIDGLKPGQRIIIPDGKQPAAVATRSGGYSYYRSGFAFGSSAIYGYNGYSFGYCTWYVANKRSVPVNWGDAISWDEGARAAGYTVSTTPKPGAILQDDGALYGFYHVGYVEAVYEDGSILVSEMNVKGWNRISQQVHSASTLRAKGIEFIY